MLRIITDVTPRGKTYPLAPFLRGRGNQGSPLRVGEGSGEGSKTQREPPLRTRRVTSVLILLSLSAAILVEAANPPTAVGVPPEVLDPPWLETRRQAQIAAAADYAVFCDFSFADRQPTSGITFHHRIVDDSGRHYRPNHYDHGNGIALADVDDDGRTDLYFVNQTGPNGLWRNAGDGQFTDITERGGVALADRIGVTASFADLDNDGAPDLYVTNVRVGNVLFRNQGDGHFADISQQSGLDHQGHSSAALFFDYDRDGQLDLFLTNVGQYTERGDPIAVIGFAPEEQPEQYHYYVGFKDAFAGHLKPERTEPSLLFRNVGENRFVDVTEEVGIKANGWSGDAMPLDANEDGWPDLYVLNMQGHDQYYENDQGQCFIDKSLAVFPRTPWGAMSAQILDFDNDGHQDLYITDMHSDMSEDIGAGARKAQIAHCSGPRAFSARAGAASTATPFTTANPTARTPRFPTLSARKTTGLGG